ncbi:hypothetical protein [Parerythrobacter jejuensis]|uniref:Heme exporter protein D n=1 Tax=Parerythrobacter jejuensis TaxID=795812 RepID=A0A845AR16_9SPHN|nr:hypothetical protein [Parerythrobacter jejuensis]MXP32054.1 hypothetical protein [Parerythrobacter jejuensis]
MMREGLDQWNYVAASYIVGIAATLAMIAWAWWSMKRAEAKREKARKK